MKLTVLVDNNTYIDKYYNGEPGLSFYIEDNNKRILFDTGYSDTYLNNAKKLNIDLNNIDYLVLSHGHNDHTGGLKYLDNIDTSKTVLIAHPDLFIKRSNNNIDIGSPLELKDIKVKDSIITSSAYQLTENLYYLGEIERIHSFENRTIGITKDGEKDAVKDDSALAYKTDKGIFIITACSHSGICNIIDKAKKILNDNRIVGIIGGFHLLENNEQLDKTIAFFKDNSITSLYPCHCVSLFAKHKMMDVTKVNEVGVGLQIEL